MIAKVPKSVNQVKNCWGVTAGQQGWAAALLSPDSDDEDEDEEDPEINSVRSGYRLGGMRFIGLAKFIPQFYD